jgi:hypothetical protein
MVIGELMMKSLRKRLGKRVFACGNRCSGAEWVEGLFPHITATQTPHEAQE